MRPKDAWVCHDVLVGEGVWHAKGEGIMAKLSALAVRRQLARLKGWKQLGNAIEKQYTFANFKDAMFFVNTVAGLAEKAGHHPDITVTYNRVTLNLSTQDAGGLTRKDFDLARRIEAAV
jgi:4a-hydroxytetrahydrobiopterin dehydratase